MELKSPRLYRTRDIYEAWFVIGSLSRCRTRFKRPMKQVSRFAEVNMARILQADDESTARRIARWVLENDGHQVTDVEGGEQAVQSATADPPDLILLDRRMPDLDGLEVLRTLRGNEATRGIPVIMITSVQEPHDVGDVLQEGVAAYLTKPYEREKLVRAVNRALTRREKTAGVQEPSARPA